MRFWPIADGLPGRIGLRAQEIQEMLTVFTEPQHQAKSVPWHRLIDPLLKITVVWCIFSFKILFVRVGEAGLRPDDLLILASFAALLLAGRVRQTPVSIPLRLYLLYVGVEVISAVWNASQGRVELAYSLVFVLRLLEYVAFYFIGHWLARSEFSLTRVATYYLYTLCFVVPLQMLSLLPVPGVFGPGRASGNTNGPYELAVVCGFLLCYVAYRKRSVLVGIACVTLILLTASRITLIASVLSLLHFALSRTQSLSKAKLITLTSALCFLGGGLYLLSSVGQVHVGAFDRLENSSSLGIEDARSIYDAAPIAENASKYMEGSFQDFNGLDTANFDGDMSGLIRFTRWLTLLKTTFAHVDSIIIGLGPSFGSAAVDGYYTRCFVETGALGLLAFLAFLGALLFSTRGTTWYFRDYIVIVMVSAIFIDTFLSYKSMLFLWLWHGVNQYRRCIPSVTRRRRHRGRTRPFHMINGDRSSTGNRGV